MPDAPADERIEHLLAGLNEPQREAVTHESTGRCWCSPAPASGKTRVLTHRLAWLIQTGRARPGEILAITFTNKAAQEMRERVELLLGHSTRGDVGDDLPQRLRADPARRGAAARLHAPVHDLRPGRQPAARQAVPRRARRSTPSASRPRRSSTRSPRPRTSCATPPPTASWSARTSSRRSPTSTSSTSAAAPDERDGLRRPALPHRQRAASCSRRCARATSATFRHVLVDEYQDTNHAQYRLLQLLAGRAPEPDGRRRRRAVDLRLPRRRHPQHPRLPGRLPRRDGRQARAELPLDADDPRRRQRA